MRPHSKCTVARLLAVVAFAAVLAPATTPASARPLLDTLALPNGFQPEGIAIGSTPYAYFGSRASGDIIRIDLASGARKLISRGPGTPSLGMKLDRAGRLFVAGGTGGDARVVDARTGKVLAGLKLATAATSFVNDVILTPRAAYFTDSANPVLYRVALDTKGRAPEQSDVRRIPLTGAIRYGAGNNANGIVRTPDGSALLIVQSNTGKLFRVAANGVTTELRVGEALTNGDGLLSIGQTLFVAQNRLNRVSVLTTSADGRQARVVSRITDSGFDTPTTIALHDGRLYLPNARFTTPPTTSTRYTAVSLPLP
jgi:sugar lactone lactonase YvrE